MLELKNITKDYFVGDEKVHALKGVTLGFRENEMVSILGQSGCGKTTLLNIIGGLDRYTDGDLVINGRSTKDFKDSDWDAYRNCTVGFVFQSYNLIPHLTVLGNVELALTLSGVKKAERQRRAIEALKLVGLEKEIKKRPNQMSGGQMQRVAIARALVNNPDIILADEPTGALDSATSVQVMDILKDVAKDRLVIMVTHNRALAEQYSTRIISMLDGNITDDTSPVEIDASAPTETATESERPSDDKDGKEIVKQQKRAEKEHKLRQKEITRSNKAAMKRTSMSFWTAFGLSARNLITKKGRTIATSVAGSIGIIGVALVLALANGFNRYIDDIQTSMLANYPVSVLQTTVDVDDTIENMQSGIARLEEFPDGTKLHVNIDSGRVTYHYNRITQDYLDYVDNMPDGYCIDVMRAYSREKVILSNNSVDGTISRVTISTDMMGNSTNFQPLLNNFEYVKSQYDYWGKYPESAGEIAVVVGKDNSINMSTLTACGLKAPDDLDDADFADLIGQKLKIVLNNGWFTYDAENGVYRSFNEGSAQSEWQRIYDDDENTLTLEVVGVMRIKESATLALYSSGLVYSPALDAALIEDGKQSDVGKAQAANPDVCVSDALVLGSGAQSMDCVGKKFTTIANIFNLASSSMGIKLTAEDLMLASLQAVGCSDIPSSLNFYPVNFEKKGAMLDYLNAYNIGKDADHSILPLDAVSIVTDSVSQMIDIMSYVLIAFAAISLVVSSVMISIITYASVVERTKEIGVLRAVGARKLDIMRVFNAETMIIGFAAGVIGVLVTFIISFPLSALFIGISGGMVTIRLVSVAWWHVLLLIAISVIMTFIAGMLPAYSASKRDPVVALRSE